MCSNRNFMDVFNSYSFVFNTTEPEQPTSEAGLKILNLLKRVTAWISAESEESVAYTLIVIYLMTV